MAGRIHLWPRSIRGRLTALATLVAAVVFVAGSGVVLATAPETVRGLIEQSVELTVRQVAGDVRRGDLRPTLMIPEENRTRVQFLEVRSLDGQVLASVPGAAGSLPLDGFVPSRRERPVSRTVRVPAGQLPPAGGSDYHVVALRVRGPQEDAVVYSGGSLLETNRIITLVRYAVLIGTPFVLLLVALVTWVIVGLALRPVERIRAELSAITGLDLGQRVPVPGTRDEISRLARTTNDTLERLERSAGTQQRFIADASHELRSPLAGLRTELEVAADDPDPDWKTTNARVLAGVERMSGMVEELLILARLDGGAPSPREVVDLVEVASAQLDRRKAAPVPINGLLSGPARVLGSPLQLDRLFTNLLDNAERHGENLVTLRVAVDSYDRHVVIEVTDDGRGVAPEDRERIFERFTRLQEGRTRDPGGSGLGLPLAREIVTAHGGTLVLDSAAAVTRFVARIPLWEPST